LVMITLMGVIIHRICCSGEIRWLPHKGDSCTQKAVLP
jgi:hypothetical protein